MINDFSIQNTEIIEESSKYNGGSSSSCTTLQQKLYQDMEDIVRKRSRYLHELENMPSIEVSKWYLLVKRSMDMFVGLLGLIILSPLFIVVGIMIKIDSRGPIIYSQERVGKKGKLFKMYKFRTMVDGAEGKTGPVWATDNDPRLTYIGRFLRNSKIDEIPQFINLIKGDMTMIGPRPERPFFVDKFAILIPGYTRRLEVTPGIAGLAQLRNGYDQCALDVIRKLRWDITYIKKMKLSLDLKLLWETFVSGITGKL